MSTGRINDVMISSSGQFYNNLSSKISIINDPAAMNADPMVIYVQNRGKQVLSVDNVVLMVDGFVWDSKCRLLDGDVWEPSRILCLELKYPRLTPGIHNVRVLTDYGVSDGMEFRV